MRQPQKYNQHLKDLPKQTREIHDNIKIYFKTGASTGVLAFLRKKSDGETAGLKSRIEDNIISRLNDVLAKLQDEKTTNSERSELMKEYFKLIHPKTFVTQLNHALDIKPIKKDYSAFLVDMKENTPFPTLFQRYKVDEKMFNVYQAMLYERMEYILQKLQLHAEQINSHFSLMEELAREREGKQFLQIGAGLLGSFAAGPLGGIVSRNIVKAFSNDEAYIDHSLNEIANTWNEVIHSYGELLYAVKVCYEAIFASLYGGYFLKIQNDLLGLGYEIQSFDPSTAELVIGVKEEQQSRIIAWIQENEKAIIFALQQQKFPYANQLITNLQQYLAANDPINHMLIDEIRVKDYVHQLKYRFFSAYIEKVLWEKKKYSEALRHYLELVKELPAEIDGHATTGALNLPSLHTIFLRMILVVQQQKSGFEQLNDAFFTYCSQHNNPQSLAIQAAKSYELAIGAGKVDHKITISGKAISYDQLLQEYKNLISELDAEKDPFYRFLKGQRRLKSLGLQPLANLNHSYNELTRKYKILKKQYFLPILLVFAIGWNSLSFASAGKLAPGLDSIYFHLIENKLVHTGMDDFAFKKAIDRQDYRRALNLIEIGTNPNMMGSNGKTILANAIADEQPVSYIKELLELSVDPNRKNEDGSLPLESSLEVDNLELTTLLLEHGADPNILSNGSPLLFSAIGNEDLLKVLLKFGADCTLEDNKGFDALQYLETLDYEKKHSNIMALLLQDANKSGRYSVKADLLKWAIVNEDQGNLETMLRMKGNANAVIDGKPLLFYTVDEVSSTKMIMTLLNYRANPNQLSKSGEHLLTYAVKKEKDLTNIVQLLLERGVDPNVTDKGGKTPLIHASIKSSISLVELLLEEGANPNIVDKDEKSALMYAAQEDSDPVFTKLLAVSKVDGLVLGRLLVESIKDDNVERAHAMLAKKADPNVSDETGEPLILLAVMNSEADMVKTLLKAGADPNVMNKEFVTPLQYALDRNMTETVQLLKDHGANPHLVVLKKLEGYWTRDHDEADAVRISKTKDGLIFESTFEGYYRSQRITDDAELLYADGDTQQIDYDASEDSFYIMSGSYRRITKEEYEQNVKELTEKRGAKEAKQSMLLGMVGLWKPTTFIEENSSIYISQFDSSPIILRVDISRIDGGYMLRISETYTEINGNEINASQDNRKFKVIDQNTIQYSYNGGEYITLKRVAE